MKKSRILYLVGAVSFLLSCGENPPNPGPDTPPGPQEEILPAIEVSRIVRSSAGKVYLEVDGKPFPLFGAQIRVDVFKNVDKLTDAQIEPYFRKAKELNVNYYSARRHDGHRRRDRSRDRFLDGHDSLLCQQV